jgi:hypothetical protein
MSQPSQWERAQMEMRDKAMAAVRQAFDRPERHGGKQEFKILQAIRALPLSPPPGEEKPMDRLSRMNAEARGRAGLPLGHEFGPCRLPEFGMTFHPPDHGDCHTLIFYARGPGDPPGNRVCGQPRSAHVAAPPEKGESCQTCADGDHLIHGCSYGSAPPPQGPSEEERRTSSIGSPSPAPERRIGPCGTPLTPEGIAAYAFETFDGRHRFTQRERDWRYEHVQSLIESLIELQIASAFSAPPAAGVEGLIAAALTLCACGHVLAIHIDTEGSKAGHCWGEMVKCGCESFRLPLPPPPAKGETSK